MWSFKWRKSVKTTDTWKLLRIERSCERSYSAAVWGLALPPPKSMLMGLIGCVGEAFQ